MHPIVFSIQQFKILGLAIGPVHVFSYGVFLALAFLGGLIIFLRDGAKLGLKAEDQLDMTIYIIVLSIVGARLMYWMLSFDEYASDPLGVLKIYQGGLSYHGGAIGGTAAVFLFAWRKKIPGWKLADAAIRPLIVGAAIARFGCFFNGCCYGHEWHGPWAVVFPNLQDGMPRHPVQFYDAGLHAILFAVVTYLYRYKRRDGDISAFYLMGFAILRFITEAFRSGATAKVFIAGLTQAQSASFLIFAAGLFLFLYKRSSIEKTPLPAAAGGKKTNGSSAPVSGGNKSKKKKKK